MFVAIPVIMDKLKFFCLIIFLLLCLGCKHIDNLYYAYGKNNAIWAQSIYLRGFNPTTKAKLTDKMIKDFSFLLKSHNIQYAYIFAGPYQNDGHLPSYPFTVAAAETINKIKKYNPDLILLPWIGGIQNNSIHLEDSLWVKNAVSDTKKLISFLKVPGVHIDLEYILPGDRYMDSMVNRGSERSQIEYGDNVNAFLKEIRNAVPEAFLSSVVVATSPDSRPWKRKTSMKELTEMIKYIDQLSFLYYDTKISEQSVFEENCKSLVIDISRLKAKREIQYLIAIGTFINEPELRQYRDVEIENIPNSLIIIKKSMEKIKPKKKIIDGIALYCEWTTSPDAWTEFDKFWLGK